MQLTNNYSYRPDEARIKKIEDIWGIKLPKDYCELLIKYNGGIPDKREFKCGKQTRMIERFLCIKEENKFDSYTCYDINVVLTEVEERIISTPDIVGYEIIPIAELFAGDMACLDYRQSLIPDVCVWYHEESEEWKPSTQKVANSFSEFMEMLF